MIGFVTVTCSSTESQSETDISTCCNAKNPSTIIVSAFATETGTIVRYHASSGAYQQSSCTGADAKNSPVLLVRLTSDQYTHFNQHYVSRLRLQPPDQ